MSDESEQKIKAALERERQLRIRFARDSVEDNETAEDVLRRALERERKMKEDFQRQNDEDDRNEAESILSKALEKEREMRESLEEGMKLPTLDEVIDAVEKDEMVKTIRDKGLLSEEAIDAIIQKTDGLTAAEAMDALKKMDVGIPDDVSRKLFRHIVLLEPSLAFE